MLQANTTNITNVDSKIDNVENDILDVISDTETEIKNYVDTNYMLSTEIERVYQKETNNNTKKLVVELLGKYFT